MAVLVGESLPWKGGYMQLAIQGVGYEGQDIVRFVRGLVRSGVGTVVDVRLTPVSRKKGFSKRALNAHLATVGIRYVHTPALGNPQWNRAAFAGPPITRAQARQTCRQLYGQDEAVVALDEICALAAHGQVALLCFEADESRCHRAVVLDVVRERLSRRSGVA